MTAPADHPPEPATHIRERLTRLGGNSFYRDRHERKTSTLCGVPGTSSDWGIHTATAKKHAKLAEAQCCPACLAKARARR